MIYTSLLTFTLSVAALSAHAADPALLAIPGKIIFESKLDTAPADPWKAAKGAWTLAEGVMRGAEKPEDKHGAVTRLPNKLTDFVIDYEFKFEGARTTSLSVNAAKGHMARISIMPKSITVQRDDTDHEGPDTAVVFARFAADLAAGTWHKVHMEMVGDTLVGQVDSLIAYGSNDLFKQPKLAPGFTVGGQSVDFRNFSIHEATLNPAWDSMKAKLPAPGSQLAPLAAGPGAAAAKGKGKGK